jgi:hypothetical protein
MNSHNTSNNNNNNNMDMDDSFDGRSRDEVLVGSFVVVVARFAMTPLRRVVPSRSGFGKESTLFFYSQSLASSKK